MERYSRKCGQFLYAKHFYVERYSRKCGKFLYVKQFYVRGAFNNENPAVSSTESLTFLVD